MRWVGQFPNLCKPLTSSEWKNKPTVKQQETKKKKKRNENPPMKNKFQDHPPASTDNIRSGWIITSSNMKIISKCKYVHINFLHKDIKAKYKRWSRNSVTQFCHFFTIHLQSVWKETGRENWIYFTANTWKEPSLNLFWEQNLPNRTNPPSGHPHTSHRRFLFREQKFSVRRSHMFLHQTSSLYSEIAPITTPGVEELHAVFFLFYFCQNFPTVVVIFLSFFCILLLLYADNKVEWWN